jgi:tetratricopeptide (TPR) repeat protein
MNSERWAQIKEIFQAAIDLPQSERLEYVRAACAGDDELRREVESLLKSEATTDAFLGVAAEYVPGALSDDERPDANIGRRIGPYQIVREIGAGGMGAVYLAERVDEFRRKAALKLLGPAMDSRMVVARFRHERQILAGLEHPNIARLLDGGATDDGRPYFVMEYVEGVPVDIYCNRHELSVTERLRLFRQVCAAVQYAHQNLVVHRDIKPGNILVDNDGIPKLLDFGIAKLIGPQEVPLETAARTQAGMRLMTPEYASPEQVRGLPITTATDVYSLGVVLYQMLAGRLPYEFPTHSLFDVERVVCESEPPPPSSVEGGARSKNQSKRLSGDVDIIVLKALEKDPKRRYGSVEQFSDDIRRHLESQPIAARRPTLMYRTGKFVRRNRTAVIAAALVLVMLTGGLIATGWEAHVARQERARAERRFNDVRHLAESFLFEFDAKIENLPGSTPARNLLVKQALTLLGSLTQEARGDVSLERELAEAYERVGQVQGNPFSKNLGDTAGAISSYQQSLRLAQDMVQRDPKDVEARSLLARAHRALGDLLPLRSDMAGAVSHYREGVSQLEAVGAATSPDLKLRAALSSCYEGLGDILGHSGVPNFGDLKAARQAYEKGLEIDEGVVREHPQDVRARAGVADLQAKIGDVQMDQGDAAGALRTYQSAAPVFDNLSAADPVNTDLRRKVGWIHRKLGQAYEATGQTEAARAEFGLGGDRGRSPNTSNIETARQAMLADPTNIQARMDYAVAVRNQGGREENAGHQQAALADYRQVLDLLRPMYAADPDNSLVRDRYADTLMMVGGALGELHKESEARQLYGEGLSIEKKFADRPDATPDDLESYDEGLMDAPVEELRNPAAAIAYARRAVEATKGEAWFFLDRLAVAYSKAGDYANAVAFDEKAISLMGPSANRSTLEERLRRFQAAGKKQRP